MSCLAAPRKSVGRKLVLLFFHDAQDRKGGGRGKGGSGKGKKRKEKGKQGRALKRREPARCAWIMSWVARKKKERPSGGKKKGWTAKDAAAAVTSSPLFAYRKAKKTWSCTGKEGGKREKTFCHTGGKRKRKREEVKEPSVCPRNF